MIKIEAGGFTLICQGEENNLTVTGFEGMDAVLDLSDFSNIREIGRKAFLFCKSLKRVTLPESIEIVGEWAFSKCSNLKSIKINKAFSGNIFGRSVFEGCESLEKIEFLNSDEGLSKLHALTANMLLNDHLLRGDDLGEDSWYEKWDIYFLSVLMADEKDANINAVVCGEEDISYDGLGSIDGEMSGETGDFVKDFAKNKCLLCYRRLLYDKKLSQDTRDKINSYIRERAFKTETAYSWITLKENCAAQQEYYKIYLDIVKPDKNTLEEMIEDLGSTQVQIKAFLIGEASSSLGGDSFFDNLFL